MSISPGGTAIRIGCRAAGLLAMLLPFALQAAEPESAGFASERLARVDAYVEQQIAAGRLAGAVVTVARHGQVVHDSAYGHANLETRRTMRGDELFRL